MNATSSRSHAVLQVKISQQARTKNIKSTLNVIILLDFILFYLEF